MTIKISQLGNVTTVLGNVLMPLVANVAGTLTTVKGNVDQVKTYILGTIESDLANLTANAGSQADSISSLTANAAVQAGLIADLSANAAVQAGLLSGLEANAASQSGFIANLSSGTATFGNLVPSANVTYSLGSPSAQWKDLYLSGSTIYIGGAEISISGGTIQTTLPISADITANTLTVADTQLTFSQGSYIDETEVAGQPGVYGLALNSPDDGIVGMNALDSNATVTSSVIVSNVSVQVNVQNTSDTANVHVWAYLEDGSLLWPDLTVQATAFTAEYVTAITDTEANVSVLQGNVAAHDVRLGNLEVNGANILVDISTLQSNVEFTMSNLTHWTSNVTTINDALNQLAERVWNLENP